MSQRPIRGDCECLGCGDAGAGAVFGNGKEEINAADDGVCGSTGIGVRMGIRGLVEFIV